MVKVKREKYVRFFAYIGSKTRLLNYLTLLVPASCNVLVEVFGGSGAFALNRGFMFDHAIYNEKKEHLVRLFRLMKDPYYRDILIAELPYLEWNKDYCEMCIANIGNKFAGITDDVEKAKQTFAAITQSYSNGVRDWGGRPRLSPATISARLERVAQAMERIDEISNLDAFVLIEREKRNSSHFLYCDPIYVNEDRYSDKDEDGFDHEKFAWSCRDADCSIAISNRSNGIYDKELSKDSRWHKIYLRGLPKPTNVDAESNGACVFMEFPRENVPNEEYIYLNYRDYSPFLWRMKGVTDVPFFKSIEDIQ